jgi:hypothetical protein
MSGRRRSGEASRAGLWPVVVVAAAVALATTNLGCQLVDPIADLDRGHGDASRPPPADPGVFCGIARCPVPEVCCYAPDAGVAQCMARDACAGEGLYAYACSDHADCVALDASDAICCATYGVTVLSGSACLASCADVVLCDPAAPEQCATGCAGLGAHGTPPGYSYCPAAGDGG